MYNQPKGIQHGCTAKKLAMLAYAVTNGHDSSRTNIKIPVLKPGHLGFCVAWSCFGIRIATCLAGLYLAKGAQTTFVIKL